MERSRPEEDQYKYTIWNTPFFPFTPGADFRLLPRGSARLVIAFRFCFQRSGRCKLDECTPCTHLLPACSSSSILVKNGKIFALPHTCDTPVFIQLIFSISGDPDHVHMPRTGPRPGSQIHGSYN